MESGGTISLLPESRRRLEINIPGEKRPLYFGVAVILLVLVVFAGLKFYQSSLTNNLAEIENEINAGEVKRDKEFEKEAVLLHKQFSLVGDLMQNHTVWSNVLITLQSLAPSQIQLKTVLGDITENKIEVIGRAPNLTTIAKQIAALLSNEAILDVSLDKASASSIGILEYSLRIIFDRNKLLLNK